MKRSHFLRTAMMAIAVSLVPKILQPVELTPDGNIKYIAGESPFDGYPSKWIHYDEVGAWTTSDMTVQWDKWWNEFTKQSMGIKNNQQ